jgi:hypothetical protein
MCVPDEPWMCQGDVDHIGRIGQRHSCPSLDELRADHEERKRRSEAAEEGSRQDSAASTRGAAASGGSASAFASRGGDWGPSGAAHLEDLQRRSTLAKSSNSYGKTHPYETLGVPSSATPREVKAAYKKLAQRLHPDRNLPDHKGSAEAAFADLSAAHDLLADQVQREAFDAEAAGGQAFFHDEASFQASGQQFVFVPLLRVPPPPL